MRPLENRRSLQRIPFPGLVRSVLMMLILLQLSACKPTPEERKELESVAYNKAAAIHTVIAYDEFLQKWPDSSYEPQAVLSRDRLLLAEAQSVAEVQEFLQTHPDTPVAKEANDRIQQIQEDLDWEQVVTEDSLDSYKSFLSKYPDSARENEALDLLDDLLFTKAREQGTQEAYVQYLGRPEALRRTAEARKLLESLRLDEAEKGGLQGVSLYLQATPDSPVKDRAVASLEKSLEALATSAEIGKYLESFPGSAARDFAQKRLELLQSQEEAAALEARQRPVRLLVAMLQHEDYAVRRSAAFALRHVAARLFPDERLFVDEAMLQIPITSTPLFLETLRYYLTMAPETLPQEKMDGLLSEVMRPRYDPRDNPEEQPGDSLAFLTVGREELAELLSRRCDVTAGPAWAAAERLLGQVDGQEYLMAEVGGRAAKTSVDWTSLMTVVARCPGPDPEAVQRLEDETRRQWEALKLAQRVPHIASTMAPTSSELAAAERLKERRTAKFDAWLSACAIHAPRAAFDIALSIRTARTSPYQALADRILGKLATRSQDELAPLAEEKGASGLAFLALGGKATPVAHYVKSLRPGDELRFQAMLCLNGQVRACENLSVRLCQERNPTVLSVLTGVLLLGQQLHPDTVQLQRCTGRVLRSDKDTEKAVSELSARLLAEGLPAQGIGTIPMIRLASGLASRGARSKGLLLLRMSQLAFAGEAQRLFDAAWAHSREVQEALMALQQQESPAPEAVAAAQAAVLLANEARGLAERKSEELRAVPLDRAMLPLLIVSPAPDLLEAILGLDSGEVRSWATSLTPLVSEPPVEVPEGDATAPVVVGSSLDAAALAVAKKAVVGCRYGWSAGAWILATLDPDSVLAVLEECVEGLPGVEEASVLAQVLRVKPELLSKAAASPSPWVRVLACEAVFILGERAAGEQLAALLSQETSDLVKVFLNMVLVTLR